MARLDPLIRLRKHQLDAKQRALAELLRQVEMMEANKKNLSEKLAAEEKLAFETMDGGNLDMREWYAAYSASVQEQIVELDEKIKKMDMRIQVAQDDVREAFADLKKIEITDRNRKEAEEKKALKKEGAELDDIAIERFGRGDRAD